MSTENSQLKADLKLASSDVRGLWSELTHIEERVKALESIVGRFGGCSCDGCIDSELEILAAREMNE